MVSLPALAVTGIGSVSFEDAQEAVNILLEYLPEVPFWPQMVKRGFQEDMVSQGVGGLTFLCRDAARGIVKVAGELDRDEALTKFYETALSGDLAPFALAESEAEGFYQLLAAVQARPDTGPSFLKGQVVGPVTFVGMVKGADDKAILFDDELTQAVTRGLALKAAWQAQQMRTVQKRAVVFFDEPSLTGFGSAFMTISREEVIQILTEVMQITRENAEVMIGVHCCGNTDWSMLLETPLDILSFDAYGFFDNLILYEKALKKFMARGGYLAWGLVPTHPDGPHPAPEELWTKFQEQIVALVKLGLDRRLLLSQSIFTPACGLGYLTALQTREALAALAELSRRGREWLYGA